MKRTIRKYKHFEYVVDDHSARDKTGRHIYTVDQLTELEAKDLVCQLMDCVAQLSGVVDKFSPILEKYNFTT